jgi:hypothetical protein
MNLGRSNTHNKQRAYQETAKDLSDTRCATQHRSNCQTSHHDEVNEGSSTEKHRALPEPKPEGAIGK